jgi:hypothetical protein
MRSELFHADFTVRRDDDTDRLAVDLGRPVLRFGRGFLKDLS